VPLLNVTSPATIFATGRNSSGCLSLSDTLNIIQTTPIQITTTPPSPVQFCGIPVTVEVSDGFTAIQWSDGSSSSSYIIDTLTSEAITVNAQDVNGCFTDVYFLDIDFYTDDSIFITPENPAVCGGEIEIIRASSEFSNYRWFEIQENVMVEIGNDSTIELASNGTYIVFADDTSGCYAVSDTIIVEQSQYPIPNFTYSQSAGSYTVSFTNTSQNGLEYFWTIDTLGTSFTEDTVFTFPQNGLYSVTLQVLNRCDTVEITKLVFVTLVGIEELNQISELRIGPNPAHNELNLYTLEKAGIMGLFHISDAQGRILLSVESEIRPDLPLKFNLESLKTGMYLIQAQTNKGIVSTRFIKE
jgi:hypothetical protein